MPARVKIFFCFFVLSFFFGHTTPLTPKSGLICSVKLCFDDHGSFAVIFRDRLQSDLNISSIRTSSRGRDASCLAPPAQIRTGRFPACGSYRRYLASKRR